MAFWKKISLFINGHQEVDRTINSSVLYRGTMDSAASSFDIMLNDLFDKLKINRPLSTGQKIIKFGKQEEFQNTYVGDFATFYASFIEFNKILTITKHGNIILGMSEHPTFFYEGRIHIFDKEKQDKVQQEFEKLMEGLIKIHKET